MLIIKPAPRAPMSFVSAINTFCVRLWCELCCIGEAALALALAAIAGPGCSAAPRAALSLQPATRRLAVIRR